MKTEIPLTRRRYCRRLKVYIDAGKIRMHISPSFAVFLALCTNISEGRMYLLSFLCAAAHEMTHLLCLFYYGCEKAYMDFYPGGIRLHAVGFSSLSYKKTVICTLSAPFMNIFSGILWLTANKLFFSEVCRDMAYINFIMSGINLLPMPFLDGGRALNAVLMNFLEPVRASRILSVLAAGALLSLAAVFFITVITGKIYFSLLIFLVYCTLGCVNEKRKSSVT